MQHVDITIIRHVYLVFINGKGVNGKFFHEEQNYYATFCSFFANNQH